LARFLSVDSGRRPLHHVLIEHGLSEPQAQAIEADIAPGCSIVTAYAEDDPERVADLMYAQRGQVVGGVDDALDARTPYGESEPTAMPRDGRAVTRETLPTERGELEYSSIDDFEVEEFHLSDRLIPRY